MNNLLTSWKRKKHLKNIFDNIDLEKFRLIENKFMNSSPEPGYSKYLNIHKWIDVKLNEAYRLHLDKLSSLNILDIGTGAGYFPYVCNFLGHNVLTLDLNDITMYNEIIKLLNIDRIESRNKTISEIA